ncbi:MAG TPA: PIN domain-containing protein [Microthrixaceae bacterium]|nr:PIN domain-containing protein [Microthrixaceae bacterium]
MTKIGVRGPAVVDTDVFSADLIPGSILALRYRSLTLGRPTFISFQTAAEIRFGAQLRGRGINRLRLMESRLAAAEVVDSGPELIEMYVKLRVACHRSGHPLAQKVHDADRWVAATAIRLDLPLIANDGVFDDVPGLLVERPPS